MEYISSCGTVRNTKMYYKPNEDYVLCDDEKKIYILLDGVSRDKIDGKYPDPSPALEVTELFAKEAYDYLQGNYDQCSLEHIKKAFIRGNEAIAGYNAEYEDFLPGTVGIVCVAYKDRLYYGYIGDCYGRFIVNGKVKIFTKCQTENIAAHKREFSASEIRNKICNNPQHPYAYGVLTGQKEAMEFVVLGECTLTNVDGIILSSDGMEPYLSGLKRNDFENKAADYYLNNAIHHGEDDKAIIIVY